MDGLKIAIIGESWGVEESYTKKPFIGAAGQELTRMLTDAGIKRSDCYLTNVFNEHPPRNDEAFFLTDKKSASKLISIPLQPSKYLAPQHEHHITRLWAELEQIKPNLCILLGNVACWAVINTIKISKMRGTVQYSNVIPNLKCLPAYHPAAVLRQYALRHTTVLDFMKAKREAEFPEIRRPLREIWLDPTLADLELFYNKYILPATLIACDIETNYGDQMTCIGFAPSKSVSICIPFFDLRKPNGSYWDTLNEEVEAVNWVQRYLNSPAKKIYQNGLFDMQHQWSNYGLTVNNGGEDSMLLHHALHPEALKALDFLGSVYTDESAWKAAKPKGLWNTLKRNG